MPWDSNLWTNPAAGSAKKTFPNVSTANVTDSSSLPGPSPLSSHAPRNSNGGGACGFGDVSARLAHDVANNAMSRVISKDPHCRSEEHNLAGRNVSDSRIVPPLRKNHTTRVQSAFRAARKSVAEKRGVPGSQAQFLTQMGVPDTFVTLEWNQPAQDSSRAPECASSTGDSPFCLRKDIAP